MNHRARKRFGQNFLVDDAVIRRIMDAISPRKGELVVEIGPGQGALTVPLAESGAELILLEIDRDLATTLHERFSGQTNVKVIDGDALAIDPADLVGQRPYRLAGNLPYNISTPLVFHVLDSRKAPLDMHFMLQKEVVQRMSASPGNRNYGRLSVMCQNQCEVVPLFDIDGESFNPPPRVESTFVRLLPRQVPLCEETRRAQLDQVVRQAFSKRRKTLRNSLKGLVDASALERLGIDPGLRAEQLSVPDFIRIASELGANGSA